MEETTNVTATAATENTEQTATEQPKGFTQAELDSIVEKRLAKEQAKTQKLIADARTEGEKLAKMTADQKAEHERKQQEESLNARLADITKRELKATALEALTSKGLPTNLVDVLNFADADTCNTSIEAVEKAFRAALEVAVTQRLAGTPPKGGQPGTPQTALDAAFYRLNPHLRK
jgi:hypothetical protein